MYRGWEVMAAVVAAVAFFMFMGMLCGFGMGENYKMELLCTEFDKDGNAMAFNKYCEKETSETKIKAKLAK